MLNAAAGVTWAGTLLWLAIITVTGFAVAYLFTDRWKMRQGPYIGVLFAATAALAAAYTAWSGLGGDFWTHNWYWGVLGAAAAGLVLYGAISGVRIDEPLHPHPLTAAETSWQAVVYGAAEGMLLSVLPVIVVWQAFDAANWAGGAGGWLFAAVAALATSVVVIVTHHLGYAGYRGGPRLRMAVIGCSALSLAFVLTGSIIAPIVGHMVLHLGIMRRGAEMPPLPEVELAGRVLPGRMPVGAGRA